jgi:hypothetical protein
MGYMLNSKQDVCWHRHDVNRPVLFFILPVVAMKSNYFALS